MASFVRLVLSKQNEHKLCTWPHITYKVHLLIKALSFLSFQNIRARGLSPTQGLRAPRPNGMGSFQIRTVFFCLLVAGQLRLGAGRVGGLSLGGGLRGCLKPVVHLGNTTARGIGLLAGGTACLCRNVNDHPVTQCIKSGIASIIGLRSNAPTQSPP